MGWDGRSGGSGMAVQDFSLASGKRNGELRTVYSVRIFSNRDKSPHFTCSTYWKN